MITEKILPFLLLAFIFAPAGDWLGFAAPIPINDASAVPNGLWLATGGGMRFIDNQFQTKEYTAADGLGETPQAAVVF